LRRLIALVLFAAVLAPLSAAAQDMNIAVSRLRIQAEDAIANPDTPCSTSFTSDGMPLTRAWCPDEDAWRRVMTQFAGAMIPPLLTNAGTRGMRGIYVGFETWLTGIDNGQEYWHRAVEGDGGERDRSRFVDNVLAWGRLNVRKGLPFGFEIGTNIGYLANTTYWTLGLELRWALFEGFREDVGWIPDFAVRGAVQTMLGDGEFNVTVPSVDFILSEPFVVANSVEITPSIFAQIAWIFADSELVDLDPNVSAAETCDPRPTTPTPGSGSPPYCRGDGMQLNHNVVFPSIRSVRARLGGGVNIRYEWFTIMGSFLFDLLPPSDLDGSLPTDLPRQWQVDLGAGLTF